MEQVNDKLAVAPVKQTAVMIRREMAKIPAVMDALEPVERAVFLASTAKTVAEYAPTDLAAELATALKWICKDVGFRSTDEGDAQYIVIRTTEILKRYYPNLTLKDFRMAFEMSITGQLDEFLPRGRDGQADRGHYQQFNAEYVCKILNAYKNRRGWILKKAREAMPEPPKPPIDPATKMAYHRDFVNRMLATFEEYKQTRVIRISPIAERLYYDELANAGLVGPVEITAEEQREIWQKTINMYARDGMLGDISRLKSNGPEDPELMPGAYVLARRKALTRVFDELITRNVELSTYIH